MDIFLNRSVSGLCGLRKPWGWGSPVEELSKWPSHETEFYGTLSYLIQAMNDISITVCKK